MPYVPSEKTNPPAQDRKIIDAALEPVAKSVAVWVIEDQYTPKNKALVLDYHSTFTYITESLKFLLETKDGTAHATSFGKLATAIRDVGAAYGYDGAFLGELNYAITRLIQRVPQILVQKGAWKEELRYWVYACTVEALQKTAEKTQPWGLGIGGVFTDIKDEYKRRVNTAYEAAQILKSGDCYDTPHYTRLVEVVDETGTLLGYQEIMLKRNETTLRQDLFDFQLVAKKRPNAA